MVEHLSKFVFPKEWNIKRNPVRPEHLRVFDFDKNYDWDTVWNDVIQINPSTILLIGPPLYDLTDKFDILIENNGQLSRPKKDVVNLDRVSITTLTVPKQVSELIINNGGKIQVNLPSWEFQNKKTIVTISKNHPINWLKQWIDYHKKIHNIDGLLLYNNQSTLYSSEELENELQRSDVVIKVIDYDVPFGCMGGGDWVWEGKSGNYLPWDSDFAQYVMLEHAKWRYLHCAKLAINADTDELLYVNKCTLDEIANNMETSNNTVWRYKGVWIEPINSTTHEVANTLEFNDRKFENYYSTCFNNKRGIGIKWMLSPKRNMTYQWMLHNISGPSMETTEIGFGHYLAMNTSWSWTRDVFENNISELIEFEPIKTNIDKWKNV